MSKAPMPASGAGRNPKPWQKCRHHGESSPTVWACPSCLVDLREENKRLRDKLERCAITAGAAADRGMRGAEIADLITKDLAQ